MIMVDRMVYVLASLPCKASYTPSKSNCQLSDILEFSQFDCSGAASDNFCDAHPSGPAIQTTVTIAWFCGGYLLPNQMCILVLFCKADLFRIQAILTGPSATAVCLAIVTTACRIIIGPNEIRSVGLPTRKYLITDILASVFIRCMPLCDACTR